MIYFFTPYSFTRKLFEAYDHYMSIVPQDNDWVCLMDGDTAFLRSDFGMRILEYCEKYPDTGMFCSFASRCSYEFQTPPGADMTNPSILFHKDLADLVDEKYRAAISPVDRRISGHIMVIRKGTWKRIRGWVEQRTRDKNILGVDTKISYAMLNAGLPVRLMKGIYVLHYMRMKEGFDFKEHLQ